MHLKKLKFSRRGPKDRKKNGETPISTSQITGPTIFHTQTEDM